MPAKKVLEAQIREAAAATSLTESRLRRLLGRVTVDPLQCHGEPCIRGMRLMVRTIVDSLRGGMTYDDILLRYPDLTREDIDAAAAYVSLYEN
ncbi:MAG TPA: DUF433 domain-containing protein [Pyrinomonadaceae bacterium]